MNKLSSEGSILRDALSLGKSLWWNQLSFRSRTKLHQLAPVGIGILLTPSSNQGFRRSIHSMPPLWHNKQHLWHTKEKKNTKTKEDRSRFLFILHPVTKRRKYHSCPTNNCCCVCCPSSLSFVLNNDVFKSFCFDPSADWLTWKDASLLAILPNWFRL
jgi:hypothetical protein